MHSSPELQLLFFLPGHLLARQRRKGRRKTQEERESRNGEKEDDEGGEEKDKKNSMNCLQRLPAREPINANCGNDFLRKTAVQILDGCQHLISQRPLNSC